MPPVWRQQVGATPESLVDPDAGLSRAVADATYAPLSVVDGKGELIVGSAADAIDNLAVGANDTILTADSAQTLGLKWKLPTRVAASSSSDVSAVNTAVETDLISLALPTTLAAGDTIRVVFYGDQLNNTGAAVTYLYKLYIGTTAVIASNALSVSNSSSRRKWGLEVDIHIVNPASDERVGCSFIISLAGTQSMPLTSSAFSGAGYGTAAENLGSAKNVKMSVTMGTADANADCIAHFAVAEVIKA